ncbi:hypothetical protein [Aestuariivirga litoralis]|uniref:hypothetical protein n=1 Tax=Aestuariivirga litoralis TaxID=2650924 RepID=UPI0018C693F9|nr:hypothetical protein [Aestuariivirga litoralis]MBG1232428.1 hypothetical protein [Aestuariivirga litoralis]
MAKNLLKLYGTTEKPSESKMIQAGALSVEWLGGNLGKIAFGGVEVLRGISYLVRDANWGTCAAKISGLKIAKSRGGASIIYKATAANGDRVLAMKAQIGITPRQLVFSIQATPNKDFKTNRTGFVVLHPAGLAGKPVTVTHTDGKKEKAKFPKLINPGQPFFEIRALEHAPAPGLKAQVLMEGNKFEMEDQRNWSDASYKTYVCSLLDPWPYELKAGIAFEQKITITLTGKAPAAIAKLKAKATALKGKLPEIGLAVPMLEVQATLKRIADIKALNPHHLMCQLDGAGDFASAAASFAKLADATGIPIALEIILPAKAPAGLEMSAIAQAVHHAGLKPESVIVTQAHDLKSFQPGTPRPWGPTYEEMAAAAHAHFPDTKIGGGMLSFFTELNRKRPPQGLFDFITHSVCPIVHDASDAAVMQTLETLPAIFASARAFIGKAEYHLGPSTIAARMNPYGADVADNPKRLRMCLAPNDPRQIGTFAVEWNHGLIAAAANARLTRITLCDVTGPRGLFDAKGQPTPLYQFFRKLQE